MTSFVFATDQETGFRWAQSRSGHDPTGVDPFYLVALNGEVEEA